LINFYFKIALQQSAAVKLDAKLFDQTWSSSDLNSDVITQEINNLFVYNEAESAKLNFTNLFFDLDKEYATSHSSGSSSQGSGSVSILNGLFGGSGGGGGSSNSANSLFDKLAQTTQDTFTTVEIQRLLDEHSVEAEWNGNKLIPKSFEVYKLTDLTDNLQVAVISKQLIADKKNGAIIRTINVADRRASDKTSETKTVIGSVQMYSGAADPDLPWLFCNGTAVPRKQFPRLFALIGVKYGAGDGVTTFNLPDYQNRVPMGTNGPDSLGKFGGSSSQTLTVNELPAHSHQAGSLGTENAGSHTHQINDPGHDHGGRTLPSEWPRGGLGSQAGFHLTMHSSDNGFFSFGIARDTTRIQVLESGVHSHRITGQTGASGQGAAFSILQPYFTVNYIIYAG
jgi:microcystin-dependent protein